MNRLEGFYENKRLFLAHNNIDFCKRENCMSQPKTIIWDWNGTLLNDVDICVDSMNSLLSARGHKQLSESTYKEIFTFPVKEYYERAGFDFSGESFDEVAFEFIDLYREKIRNSLLFPEVPNVLNWFSEMGFAQYLVSAMEHQFLMESVQMYGILHCFEEISGIQDHFANGKASMARDFIIRKEIDPMNAIFVGDTLHDFEVAESLGMECLLVANGHQSEQRLAAAGCQVVTNLTEVMEMFRPGD